MGLCYIHLGNVIFLGLEIVADIYFPQLVLINSVLIVQQVKDF